MRGGLRAGSWVHPGPSGAAPPNARAFETGVGMPAIRGLVRHSGAGYYDLSTGDGWMCTGATAADWVPVAAIALSSSLVVQLADGVNPTVTPVVADVGTIAVSSDGYKAWRKYGTPDTAWLSLNETRASATASVDAAYLDVSIAVPATQAVVVKFFGRGSVAAGAAQGLFLRVNGSQASGQAGVIIDGGGVHNLSGGLYFVPVANTGKIAAGILKILPSSGGRRSFFGFVMSDVAAGCGYTAGSFDAGALVSIGAGNAGGNYIAAASVVSAVMADLHGSIP